MPPEINVPNDGMALIITSDSDYNHTHTTPSSSFPEHVESTGSSLQGPSLAWKL